MPSRKPKPNKKSLPTAWQEFRRGVAEESPLLLGTVPFGMIYGVIAIEAGLSPAAAFAMSFIVFGGASQVVFTQLLTAGAGGAVIAGTIGMVNLRHALYSARMADYLQHLSMRWKILLSYLLTDEAFIVSLHRMQHRRHAPHMHYHLLGTGLTLWTSWQLATLFGIFAGEIIPPQLNLGFAVPLTFLALLAPQIRSKSVLVVLAVSAGVALLLYNAPWNLWLIGGAICGMAAGYFAESLFGDGDAKPKGGERP